MQVGGLSFDDEDVAAAYAHRTPYPPAMHGALVDLAVGRGALLDLGCGPGKIAGALAGDFARVDAVDLSPTMISVAMASHPAANIQWIVGPGETAAIRGPYDLIVAGESLHWMDHAVLMPRLADALAPGAVMALVNGDGAYEAPWQPQFLTFLMRWVEVFGDVWNSPAVKVRNAAHEPWFDSLGNTAFTHMHTQDVASVVRGEHSRATWTLARMGPALAARFDAELETILAPHAVDGVLTFQVRSVVTWGRPRRSSRE